MAAIGGGTTAVLGMGYYRYRLSFLLLPLLLLSRVSVPAPPVGPPPTPLLSPSSSVAVVSSSKATGKRVRSRKGMKMVKKESLEEQGVSKGLWNGEEGRMEENAVAGVEKAGEEAASSQLGSCSVAGQSSRSNSVLFDGDSSSAEMSKDPHFHRFSQNLESCGVPARLKTSKLINKCLKSSTLSAHQMPHRHPGSEVQLWIHGSRPAWSPTVHW